jgi:hypothetical protein
LFLQLCFWISFRSTLPSQFSPEEIQLKTQQNFPVISVVGRTKALDEEVSDVEEGLEEGQEAEETEADE